MSKRRYGDGSAYQRSSDWRWIATFDAGFTDTGGRRRISVTGPGCEGGCARRCPHVGQIEKKLNRRRAQHEASGDAAVNPRDTIRKWADTWLALQERTQRPASYTASRSALNQWIIPTIGHKRLDSITPGDVRAVADAQRRAGKSQGTQIRTHSTLKTLLRAAREEGYPITERVLDVKPPKPGVSDRTSMQVHEAIAVLQLAAQIPQGSRWVAALLNGVRQGEALGLTWESVDWARNRLILDWQLQPIPYRTARDRSSGFRVPDGHEARHLEGRLHLTRPKTKSGWRIIPMTTPMRQALEAWEAECPDSPHGLVWPLLDGRPCPSKVDDLEWYALQDGAGVHHPDGRFYTSHETRHTTITLLHELGADPITIATIVGQSRLVESYLHVQESQRVLDALQGVADRLALPGTPSGS